MANPEYSAYFLVQRGDAQYVCKGDKLHFELRSEDWLAVQRGDTLYRAHKNQIQDSDWLVCMDGNNTCRVGGSKVIPLLLPPPSLMPIVTKVDGVVYESNEGVITASADQQLILSVEPNSDSVGLSKTYSWEERQGSGTFTSSPGARQTTFNVGETGGYSVVVCTVTAPGASDSPTVGAIIQIMVI